MTTVSISDLEPEKADRFEQTFRRVLASQKAVETFAQIIDGLPTRDISMEAGGDFLRPEIWQRSAPCDISVREAQQLQAKISVGTMQVKAELAQPYQTAPVRSMEFMLRLLGLVAVTVHELAVHVFRRFHPTGGPYHSSKEAYPDGTFPPDLFHPNYQHWHQYPEGPADTVGYWAEAQIFGGTVLFEHGESDAELLSAFIHPPLQPLFRLSSTQLSQFAALNEASNTTSTGHVSNVLPFAPTPNAYVVLDDIETYPRIYRDKYERMPRIKTSSSCVTRGQVTPEMQRWVNERFRHR